jgi:type II secretory pathway pseudopilin PulG
MTPASPQFVRSRDPEAGFVLLAVLFLVAVILITLAVAAPKMAQSIQRDKELELVHRGEQYKRAIKLYYKKMGSYPTSVDQLMNTNQIRFLRKRYLDPVTGKDDWKIIYYGQAHVRPVGLFGQPLTVGSPIGGSPIGSPIGGSPAGGLPVGTSPTGSAGSGISGTAGAGGIGAGSAGSGGLYAGGTGPTDGSGSTSGTDGSGTSGGTGIGGTTGGSGIGGSTTGGTSGLGTGLGSSTNPTIGGGPIVGVAIPNTKASIKEYKQQKHYNEWEFVYDPIADQLQAASLFGGAPANLNGPGSSSPAGIGPGSVGPGPGAGGGYGAPGGVSSPGAGSGIGIGSGTPQQQ